MTSTNPLIIIATPDHIPSIKSIVNAAYTKYTERIGKPPGPMLSDYNELLKTHDVFVLQEEPSPSPTTTDATTPTITTSTGSTGRKILGSIILNTDNESNSIQINNLVVDPTAQGRGYGRLLMEFAEERARVQGRTAVTLFTNVKMYENLGLYMKLGFVETGRRVEDGYERVFFWKDL